MAEKTLLQLSLVSNDVEICKELIAKHEYIPAQILQSDRKSCLELSQAWHKKLGPLWQTHLYFAQSLWRGGDVESWLQKYFDTMCRELKSLDAKLPGEDADFSPVDGNELMARYKEPKGEWIGIMKKELQKWTLANPHKSDQESILKAADVIFKNNSNNPIFNGKLPAILIDSSVSDPTVLEMARIPYVDLKTWVTDCKKKTLAAIATKSVRNKQSQVPASDCFAMVFDVKNLLRDVLWGEIFNHWC